MAEETQEISLRFTSKGWKAAPFVFAMIALENMAFLSVGINLFPYMFNTMHFSITDSANAVTNFMGTSLLLSLLGGFVSDVWLSKFWTIILGGIIEVSGFLFLTLSASMSVLRPPPCPPHSPTCQEADATQKGPLFLGLYLIALGTGAVKSNLAALGADQFDTTKNEQERRELSTYFNGAFVALCSGSLIAVTALVYIEDNVSRKCGYGIAGGSLLLSILIMAAGYSSYQKYDSERRPLISIAQVLVAAIRKWKLPLPADDTMLHEVYDTESASNSCHIAHTNQFRFLDKAAIPRQSTETNEPESLWKLCTVAQVEEVKLVMRILPIFASTIMMNCILGQLQTFSVAQGNTMDRKISNGFEIPSASLAFFPLVVMVTSVPLYSRFFVPLARRFTGHEHGITHLQRIGVGLAVSIFSMMVAALVENRRIRVAKEHDLLENPAAIIPMKIYWLALQFVTVGIAYMFTFVGLMEFFYSESPVGLRSMSTALTYVSEALGYFLNSLLVSTVNFLTSRHGNPGWLPDNLNKSELSSFYWLLAILSAGNILNYLFWASWYKYRVPSTSQPIKEKVNSYLAS